MAQGAKDGACLALGFGAARAVTSDAYISMFGMAGQTGAGFVSSSTFTLLENVLSVLAALAAVAVGLRRQGSRGRHPERLGRSGRLGWGESPVLIAALVACLFLSLGYLFAAEGLFGLLSPTATTIVAACLYAVGGTVFLIAWVWLFANLEDGRFAIRWLVVGYLVQACLYLGVSRLEGLPLALVCIGLLAMSVALLARIFAGADLVQDQAAAGPTQGLSSSPKQALLQALRSLLAPLTCVFVLTAVVGILHTSVIGGVLEHVVGAVPMAGALAMATVAVVAVVVIGSRVPDTTAVYRVLFPVMLAALSLIPFLPSSLGAVSGMAMVVCYDVVGIAFVLLLVQTAHRMPGVPAAALAGVYLAGTQASLVIGLLAGRALSMLGEVAPAATYAAALALACIYLLCLVLVVLFRRTRSARVADAVLGTSEESPAWRTLSRRGVRVNRGSASDEPAGDDEREEQQKVRQQVGSRVEQYALAHGLTPREAQVMVQLARGHTAAAIASELGIAENTTWAHIKRIYAKLDVHSKQELIDLVEQEVISAGSGSQAADGQPGGDRQGNSG